MPTGGIRTRTSSKRAGADPQASDRAATGTGSVQITRINFVWVLCNDSNLSCLLRSNLNLNIRQPIKYYALHVV